MGVVMIANKRFHVPNQFLQSLTWYSVSYGDHYTSDIDRRYKLAPLKKSHNKFGFVELVVIIN